MKPAQALISSLILMAVLSVIILTYGLIAASRANETLSVDSGRKVYNLAESGLEEAILRLERQPNFSGGVFTLGNISVTMTVTVNGNNRTIQSLAQTNDGQFSRQLQAAASFDSNGILTVNSWQ